MEIRLIAGKITLTATLNSSATAKNIANALPVEGTANVWGDEIYFEIPVNMALEENAVEEVPVGTLAYWPTGSAFCIFFGPTPASTGDIPRAYSPVTVFGRIDGDATPLKQVADGTQVLVKAITQPKP